MKFYRLAELYEPDSQYISQKIIKLESKGKKTVVSEEEKIEVHSN